MVTFSLLYLLFQVGTRIAHSNTAFHREGTGNRKNVRKELTVDGEWTIEEMLQMLCDTQRSMQHQETFEALATLEALFATDVDLTAAIDAA